MKLFIAMFMLFTLSGCVNGCCVPKTYSSELVYKCQTDPYGSYCLYPPAVFKN